jgi:hypothetical protein
VLIFCLGESIDLTADLTAQKKHCSYPAMLISMLFSLRTYILMVGLS